MPCSEALTESTIPFPPPSSRLSETVRHVIEGVVDLLLEAWLEQVVASSEERLDGHLDVVLSRRWCDGTFVAPLSLDQQLELLELAEEESPGAADPSTLPRQLAGIPRQVRDLREWIYQTADALVLHRASEAVVEKVERILAVLSDLGVGPSALHRHDPWGGYRSPLDIRPGPHGDIWVYDRLDGEPGTATDVHEVMLGDVRIWIQVPSDR